MGIRRFCFLSGQSPAPTGERWPGLNLLSGYALCPWLVHPVTERHDIRERSLCDCGRSAHSMNKAPGLPRENF